MNIIKNNICVFKTYLGLFLHRFGIRSFVHYINGSETLPPPLGADEEKLYIDMLSSDPHKAKDRLVVHNLRLVVYIAKKFESSGSGVEDLISIGTIGLIKAVNTFKPERNIKLATYASRCIENEILMFLRKTSQIKNEISINDPLNIDWDGNELLLSDILGSDADEISKELETEGEKDLLLMSVEKLSKRERQILKMRFGLGGREEKTQKEVADMLGISQSYISRLEKKIIERLKKDLSKVG